MKRIKYRIALAVITWLGIDSTLDQGGRCLAVIDHRTAEPFLVLHHRYILITLGDWLRKRLPFIKERAEEESTTPTTATTTVERPGVSDEDEFSIPDPDEIREAFANYTEHIEGMAARAKDDDPRSERILAAQREIARALDVDLSDDGVWRGVLMVAYAVSSTAHGMMSNGRMWPPPFVLADGSAAALCRTRQSLMMEGDLPDIDFVLPEDDSPDGDGWDDGVG